MSMRREQTIYDDRLDLIMVVVWQYNLVGMENTMLTFLEEPRASIP